MLEGLLRVRKSDVVELKTAAGFEIQPVFHMALCCPKS
jgi:hypothetical protein